MKLTRPYCSAVNWAVTGQPERTVHRDMWPRCCTACKQGNSKSGRSVHTPIRWCRVEERIQQPRGPILLLLFRSRTKFSTTKRLMSGEKYVASSGWIEATHVVLPGPPGPLPHELRSSSRALFPFLIPSVQDILLTYFPLP